MAGQSVGESPRVAAAAAASAAAAGHQSSPGSHSSHGPHASTHNKRPPIVIYPTVSPETVVIPIVSCILGFPLLALLVICCLRRRAKLARERERRRAGNCDTSHGALSLVRFSTIHRLAAAVAGSERAAARAERAAERAADRAERGDRSLSKGYPSLELELELDTVLEERSSDPDPDEPSVGALAATLANGGS